MMGSYTVLVLFTFLVEGVFGDADEVKSVMEGDRVILNPDVIKNHDDIVQWYFNDTLIALINGDSSSSCLYDGEDGRFRGRLEVDYETGSLTITNLRPEHTERYEAEHIKKGSSGKREKLNIPSKCDRTKITKKSSNLDGIIKSISLTVSAVPGSGLSSGVVAGICAGAVLLAVVVAAVVGGVMIFRRRSSRNDKKKNNQGFL